MQSNHITPPAEMSSTQPVSQHSYILSALQGPMARPKFSNSADRLCADLNLGPKTQTKTEVVCAELNLGPKTQTDCLR